MNDNPLIAAIIAAIRAGLTAQGLGSVGIKQAYQPTQQGAPSGPTVTLYKISEKDYGHPLRSEAFDTVAGVMNRIETQQIMCVFQVSAIAPIDPANVAAITQGDIVNAVMTTLQSLTTIGNLIAQGVGILRITDKKQTYFKDEKAEYEPALSFDFTVTHARSLQTQIGGAASVVANLVSFNLAPE